jgi:hypothetical protein
MSPQLWLAMEYWRLANDSCSMLIYPGWANLMSHVNKYVVAFITV